MNRQRLTFIAFIFCALSAITYNSWPLGYILNNYTARTSLASDLEKTGQPYFWVFIAGDVITGMLLLVACIFLNIDLKSKLKGKALNIAILGLASFGLFTAICALLPSECSITSYLKCGPQYGKGLGLDALTSSIAYLGLLGSLIATYYLLAKNKISPALRQLTLSITMIWFISGLIFAYSAIYSNESHLLQQIFLIMCGLALFIIGLSTLFLAGYKPTASKGKP
jgi:hypothetical protein